MTTTYEQAMDARTNGDLAGAAELLRRQAVANPADERSRFALGVVSIEAGNAEQAVRTLHPLVVAHPDNAEMLTFYAVALRGVRRYSDAIKVFRRANELAPSAALEDELRRTSRLLEQQPAATVPPIQQRPPQAEPPAARENGPEDLLASHLDSGRSFGGRAPEVRGSLRHTWHRRVTSYRRFWLGLVLLITGGILQALGVPAAGSAASEPWSVPRITQHTDAVPLFVLALGVLVLLATVVSARFTRYLVYEHRIDFCKGILSQSRRPVWLFDITGISLRRTPLLTLTGTTQIVVEHDTKEGKPSRERLIAVGGARAMADYAESLQGEFLRERRAMKKLWI